MNEDKGNKLTVRVNDRTMSINIVDLLEAMDEEGRQEVINHFAWDDAIWKEVKRMFADEFSAPSWNANIHEARLELLKSRFAGDTLSRVVKYLLYENATLRNRNTELDKVYWAWRAWYSNQRGYYKDQYDMELAPAPKYDQPGLTHLSDNHVGKFLLAEGIIMEDEVEAALERAEQEAAQAQAQAQLTEGLNKLQAECPHPSDRIDPDGVCHDCGKMVEWPF